MKITKNEYGEYVTAEADACRYIETDAADATSRVLSGSRDEGYWMEYVGYGTIDNIPVIAVYLLDEDQKEIEDEGDYDWDTALQNGRIIIDIDKLTDAQYAALCNAGTLNGGKEADK